MRLPSHRLALPAALVAAGAALLAPAAEARVQKVDIGSNFFAPGKKTVRTGDKVRFVWEEFGFEAHDVNVRKGPVKFSSPLQRAAPGPRRSCASRAATRSTARSTRE